jgi:transcriptional regulator with XRE-family HTH domain
MQLNDNIKLVRELSGFRQIDFAKKFGINLSNLKTYENTDVKPKANVLADLADYAGITVDDLENKKLTHKDLKIKSKKNKKVSREIPDEGDESEAHEATPVYHTQTDLSKLIESNRMMAEAMLRDARNRESLVRSNEDLSKKVTTANDQSEIVQDLNECIYAILEVLAELGTGKIWKDLDEADEALNRISPLAQRAKIKKSIHAE